MISQARHSLFTGLFGPGVRRSRLERIIARRRHRGPVRTVMGYFWALFWTGFGLAMAFSPDFRAGFLDFVRAIPQMAAYCLDWLRSGGEI